MPTIDTQFVTALHRDILAYVDEQAKFSKSDLFKLMLTSFKKNAKRVSNKEGIPDYWEGVSLKNVELFFRVMSEPEMAAGSTILDFDADDDEILPLPSDLMATEETFYRYGLMVTVNWNTLEVVVSQSED